MTRKKRRKLRLPFSLSSKKIKGWKKHQEKIRWKRLGRKLLLVVWLSGCLVFLFFGYKSFRFLTQPLVQEKGSSMSAPRWNGKTQLNFLVFSLNYRSIYTRLPDALSRQAIGGQATSYDSDDGVRNWIGTFGVASLNPTEGTLKILIIPSEILVTTEKGAYPMSKLFALGATLNPPAETDFTVESVQSYLAVPLDGYLAIEGEEGQEGGYDIENLYKQLKSPKVILSIPKLVSFVRTNLKTNLSAGQLFRLLWQIRKIRFDKLQVLEIPEHILSSKKLDSSEEVLVADERLLDEVVSELFAEAGIITERLKVSVKNGTKTPGIAGKAARFLENLGIEVIEVGNADRQNYEQTQILDYSELSQSRTLQRLEDVFGVNAQSFKVEEAKRVDVEVIVGNGF